MSKTEKIEALLKSLTPEELYKIYEYYKADAILEDEEAIKATSQYWEETKKVYPEEELKNMLEKGNFDPETDKYYRVQGIESNDNQRIEAVDESDFLSIMKKDIWQIAKYIVVYDEDFENTKIRQFLDSNKKMKIIILDKEEIKPFVEDSFSSKSGGYKQFSYTFLYNGKQGVFSDFSCSDFESRYTLQYGDISRSWGSVYEDFPTFEDWLGNEDFLDALEAEFPWVIFWE